ncbi:MAG: FGGY-family carbohydrate kinase [Trueperaceae bacterium]|nr:FGGY-family carbohydrate kinase [Trueperaceae bacterium]MCW5818844.1 FGGY-family carbohydrate kinase [Trueperaceae bacterium]
MKDAIIGIDIGTTNTKGVLASTTGELIAVASREATLYSPEPTWAEGDALQWWANTKSILAELMAGAGADHRVRALGVSGMVPTLIPLSASGTPLRRSIQQNDARASVQIAELERRYGQDRFFERTGGSINQQVLAPKLMWLAEREPDVFERAEVFCGSYDYIAYRLTGELFAEHNWALESGLLDITTGAWSDELLALGGIDAARLPGVRASHEIVGEVSLAAAAETGLPVGTPVIAGVADHVASAFAAGASGAGDLLLKYGGAGDVLYSLASLKTDPRLFIDHHVVPGLYYLNGCMATSGSLVKWFAANFCSADEAAARQAELSLYAYLDEQAAALPPGSDGLVLLPYFLGEKTPLHDTFARGTIVGLGLNHGRHHLFRAVLEGVAYGFRHHVDVLQELSLTPARILASDGGAASDLWLQITADVIGRPVQRVIGHPGSSLGAAFVAGKAVGLFDDWSEVGRFVSLSEPFEPRRAARAAYDEYYALYRETYQRLVDMYPRLVGVRGRADRGAA